MVERASSAARLFRLTHNIISMELYIVGISGLGREVANYILDIPDCHIAGFVDQDIDTLPETVKIRNKDYPVYRETAFLDMAKRAEMRPAVVLGVGFPQIRQKVAEKYKIYCRFPNVIHPSVILCDTSIKMGEGNIITPNCIITTSIDMGNFNLLNWAVTVGHDVVIGDYNVFNPGVAVSGNVEIGSCNLFGVHSCIRQGIKIGSNNILGMGGVLLKEMGNGQTWVGVPAKMKEVC